MDRIAQLKASEQKAKKRKWRGPRGFPGTKGSTGDTGVQGGTGPDGLIGPDGTVGEQGIQGLQGEEGASGPEGLRGEHGKAGDPGLEGSEGPKGDDGREGLQGTQGLQGKKGEIGLKGTDGDVGEPGIPGKQGEFGLTGPRGEKGKENTGKDGKIGPKGPKGAKGEQGEDGKLGPTNIISGGPAFMPRNAREQTSPPGVTDDQEKGYLVGSRWWDITNNKEYVCLDKTTGVAIWKETTVPAGGGVTDHSELTGLSDGDDHPQYQTLNEHTNIGDGSPHHVKYTDAQAIAAVSIDHPKLHNHDATGYISFGDLQSHSFEPI